MKRYAVIALLLAAGCAPGGTRGAPDMVQYREDVLTVRFIDGVVCRAPVTGTSSGDFPGCPHATRYSLTRLHPNALEGTGLTEPFADIDITDAAGRVRSFKTPESRNWKLSPIEGADTYGEDDD